MQIIEVRNDIFKLAYSPIQNGILLSDFLLVSEGHKSVLAQVIGIESSTEKDVNIAILKGCLSVDETGKINSYIGYTPSTSAEVSPVTQDQVISMLNTRENPLIWGYLAQHDNVLFKTEPEILKNKPLILMDDYANYNVIANNIVYSNHKAGEKTLLVDFDGSLKIDNAFYVKLGEDLKLPLSYTTLNYIYENDLKAESLSTQAVVQDIIIELQEYIVSLPEGFLPFSTIKNVIQSQYEENKIPELMLFKNKFVKYAQQDVFAENKEDFDFLNQTILENDIVVIDATELEVVWHRLLINYLAKNINTKCSFITKLENENSNKKTILDIYNNRELSPILVSSYSHEFVNVMKSIAKNLILFPPIKAIGDFPTYSAFMQKLRRDEYVVCGEDTLYLSFLVRLTYINSNMSPEYIEAEIQKDVDKLYRAGAQKTENVQTEAVSQPEEIATDIQTEEIMPVSQPEIETAITDEDSITEADLDFLDELDSIEAVEDIEPIGEILEKYEETPQSETNFDSVEEVIQETVIEETTTETEEIVEEVSTLQQEEITPATEDTTIPSATETNIIDEYSFNESTDELAQTEETVESVETVEEPQTPVQQTPPIPVYSVPELETGASIEFSEGNFVYHEKYGRGVIEKILSYGDKTLCTIEFEEVGRRLLDPKLAGLKQV